MLPLSIAGKLARIRIRTFVTDVKGAAAVEFAFIAPVLILMTFGTFEVSRALMAHKRFQRATAMVGDLVSREKQIGSDLASANTALGGVLKAAEHAMKPFKIDPLQIGITQLRASSSDAAATKVEWAWSYNSMDIKSCGDAKSMPDKNMISKGDAAVVVEAKYSYKPFLANLVPWMDKEMEWSDTMTFAPRWGAVFFAQDKLNTKCPPGSG